MSRTIRRTKARKFYSRFEKDYTHHRLDAWLDVHTGYQYHSNGIPSRPLEGKEYDIAYWKYHSDTGCPGFAFEYFYERPMEEDERSRRARYKREIVKWMKDPDYEIIFQQSKDLWDYC